jgi:hypothetical protein
MGAGVRFQDDTDLGRITATEAAALHACVELPMSVLLGASACRRGVMR